MKQGWYYVESLTGQRHDRVQTESQIATVDSCFDLVGSRQHGVASYEVFIRHKIPKQGRLFLGITSFERCHRFLSQVNLFVTWWFGTCLSSPKLAWLSFGISFLVLLLMFWITWENIVIQSKTEWQIDKRKTKTNLWKRNGVNKRLQFASDDTDHCKLEPGHMTLSNLSTVKRQWLGNSIHSCTSVSHHSILHLICFVLFYSFQICCDRW